MKARLLVVVLCWMALPAFGQDAEVAVPGVVLRNTPFQVSVTGLSDTNAVAIRVGEAAFAALYDAEAGAWVAEEVVVPATGGVSVEVVQNGAVVTSAQTQALPGWISILPPLLAIVVALLFKRVIPALFLGVWVGAWAAAGLGFGAFFTGLFDAIGVYLLEALADSGHAAIILFSLMIGGMVGIISKNGGTHGVVNWIVRWASDARRGQIATGVLGLAIFFDDYANSLIIGNTMRPVTDRLRISREKLAYIVDSTSAPVASLALVTTWIGFEVGLINEAVQDISTFSMQGYTIFLESILYRFYPILALFFVFVIAGTDREFGPMYEAEQRARTTGKVLGDDARVDEAALEDQALVPNADKPQRALNAVLPVLVLVIGVFVGLYITGSAAAGAGASLREIIGSADSYAALMWASLASVVVAILLSIGQRILTIDEAMEAWYTGLKAMLLAMIILVLAWALSATTDVLHTGAYLSSVLSEALPPGLLPGLVFVLAAVISFATGTSWGTMGILMPIVVDLSWSVLTAHGLTDPNHYYLLYSAVSCVLAGAVWGDHCSPISDTTILSSMASGCDHIEHVRTQLPYAVAVGLVALVVCTIPTGFGVPWWLVLILSMALLWVGLRFFGRPVADELPSLEVTETGAS